MESDETVPRKGDKQSQRLCQRQARLSDQLPVLW